jgi:tetratricopeptide (TPR) repeat protein
MRPKQVPRREHFGKLEVDAMRSWVNQGFGSNRRSFRTLLLSFVSAAIVAIAAQSALAADPKPGSREYAQAKGWPHLLAGRWREAAEAYGVWAEDRTIWSAWQSAEKKPQAEADLYNFELVAFHFETVNFARNMGMDPRHVQYIAKEYAPIVARLPKKQQACALDFSRLDLLDSPPRVGTPEAAEHRARVIAAMKLTPTSIPAMCALTQLIGRGKVEEGYVSFDEALPLAQTNLAKLTLVRSYCASHLAPIELRGEFEALLTLAPSSDERAMLRYWLAGNLYKTGGTPEEKARKTVEDYRKAIAECPWSVYAGHARSNAVDSLIRIEKLGEALELVRDFQRDDPKHLAGIDSALHQLAAAHLQRKDYDAAERLLAEVLRDFGETDSAANAMLTYASIEQEKGNRSARIAWLEKCAAFPIDENASIDDRRSIRADATRQLALERERDGQWAKALDLWQNWKPVSYCGTGAMGNAQTGFTHVTRCLLMQGRHTEAARECAQAFLTPKMHDMGEVAHVLFAIYDRAGQLDDLEAMIDDLDARLIAEWQKHNPQATEQMLRSRLYTWSVRRLLELDRLRREDDMFRLLTICAGPPVARRHPYPAPETLWACGPAGDMLARLDDYVVPWMIYTHNLVEEGRQRQSLLNAIAKHPAPKAWVFVEKLAASPNHKHWTAALEAAAATQSSRGRRLIESLASSKEIGQASTAKQHLERIAQNARWHNEPSPAWSNPKAGSLPKTAVELLVNAPPAS